MLSLLSLLLIIGSALAQRPFVNKSRYSHHKVIDFSSYDAEADTPYSFLKQHGLSLTDQESLVDIQDGTLLLYNMYDEARLQQGEGRIQLLDAATDLWVETEVQGAVDSCNLHDLQLKQRTLPLPLRNLSRPARSSTEQRSILSYSTQYTYIRTRAASLVYTDEAYAGHTLHPESGMSWVACEDREITRIRKIELFWNIKATGEVKDRASWVKARMGEKQKEKEEKLQETERRMEEIGLVWQM